jgi:hypothetical protein
MLPAPPAIYTKSLYLSGFVLLVALFSLLRCETRIVMQPTSISTKSLQFFVYFSLSSSLYIHDTAEQGVCACAALNKTPVFSGSPYQRGTACLLDKNLRT